MVCLELHKKYWGTKVWNIDINFVVIKKQIKNKHKNTCLVKFEVLSSQNTKKLLSIMSISDPQINLNRLGSVKKNDRNEIKSLEY